MDLLSHFISYIQKENLFHLKDKLLVAVSGGIDSVVLCDLCSKAGYDFRIAHCNFQLRGDESKRDEAFVTQLADVYRKELFVKEFITNLYAEEHKLSVQVAARELRYKWFAEILSEQNLKYLLTAHHADDNIETLLMNFFKGTGINGLTAMAPGSHQIIRPLLFANRAEIVEYANLNNLKFVEDSSNAEDKYTRNYFRHQVMPAITRVYPQVANNLANNIRRFSEIKTLYKQAVESHTKKLLEKRGNEWQIPVLKLQKTEPLLTIIYEIFKSFGYTTGQVEEIAGLLTRDSGKYVSSPSHRVFKNRKWLIIIPHETTLSENILIEQGTRKVLFHPGLLSIKTIEVSEHFKLSTHSNIAMLDAKKIKYPLLLRRWKQGDYFYPLGMQKKKKLSRFFIDLKMSSIEKEKTWVLEMDKKIVWIVGRRIDDRFKIDPSTNQVFEISFDENGLEGHKISISK